MQRQHFGDTLPALWAHSADVLPAHCPCIGGDDFHWPCKTFDEGGAYSRLNRPIRSSPPTLMPLPKESSPCPSHRRYPGTLSDIYTSDASGTSRALDDLGLYHRPSNCRATHADTARSPAPSSRGSGRGESGPTPPCESCTGCFRPASRGTERRTPDRSRRNPAEPAEPGRGRLSPRGPDRSRALRHVRLLCHSHVR